MFYLVSQTTFTVSLKSAKNKIKRKKEVREFNYFLSKLAKRNYFENESKNLNFFADLK